MARVSNYLKANGVIYLALRLTKLFGKRSHLEYIAILYVPAQWDAIGTWNQERNVNATSVKSIHRVGIVSLLTMAAAGHD
jgi:hypothetical protein